VPLKQKQHTSDFAPSIPLLAPNAAALELMISGSRFTFSFLSDFAIKGDSSEAKASGFGPSTTRPPFSSIIFSEEITHGDFSDALTESEPFIGSAMAFSSGLDAGSAIAIFSSLDGGSVMAIFSSFDAVSTAVAEPNGFDFGAAGARSVIRSEDGAVGDMLDAIGDDAGIGRVRALS
jgi:hypothetical protein